MTQVIAMPKPSVPSLNDLMCGHIDRVRSVARYLMAQGFVVLNVHVGPRNPRIVVQTCARCAVFDAAVRVRDRVGNTRREIWVAHVRGCQVEWAVNGAN